jgi:hypothetical protein
LCAARAVFTSFYPLKKKPKKTFRFQRWNDRHGAKQTGRATRLLAARSVDGKVDLMLALRHV